MPRFVAFLRAINLGGVRTVRMDSLRHRFESLDFSGVETFIASGNVVFHARAKSSRALETKIEKSLRGALGYDVDVFIRTAAESIAIANYDPFPKAKTNVHTACNIIFLVDALDKKLTRAVAMLRRGTDKFRVRRREIYWLRHRRKGGPFSTVPLAKTLGRGFTVRACNTVKRMVARYFLPIRVR